MKMVTLEKVYKCLESEKPEVRVSDEISEKAVKSIKKMLEISEKMGL